VLNEERESTTAGLAKTFKCSKPTIRDRLRGLRRSGEKIIPHNKGLLYIAPKEKVDSAEMAGIINNALDWTTSMLISNCIIANILKNPAKQSLKFLGFTKEEVMEFKKSCLFLTREADVYLLEYEEGTEE
jgi:hypothetical protein